MPANFYLFETTYGKVKLAYGSTPADALRVMFRRLTEDERATVKTDRFEQIRQQDIQKHVGRLG